MFKQLQPFFTHNTLVRNLIILTLAGIWIWFSRAEPGSTTQGNIPAPKEGFLAPEFTLESLSGEPISLADYRGQVVLINLWASWCPPCRAEMPAMQAAYRDYQEQGFTILAVNATNQDNLAEAAQFVAQNQLSFPILLDTQGRVSDLYQLRSLPTSFIIDRAGIVREVIIGGPMSETLIQTKIAALLQETP
ncbi:MAG: TlpA family protein disulfide reductase [Anaerolineales bacterium]|nr:TlpA family protein disulfide reductase [Anaerolineales bacterium]